MVKLAGIDPDLIDKIVKDEFTPAELHRQAGELLSQVKKLDKFEDAADMFMVLINVALFLESRAIYLAQIKIP